MSEVSLANMFSHTVGSLYNLVLFSLALNKLFLLMRSHLFILSFMSLAPGDTLVKIPPRGRSEGFLGLVFFFHVAVQISQHHLLKRLFLLHFMLLFPLSNIN